MVVCTKMSEKYHYCMCMLCVVCCVEAWPGERATIYLRSTIRSAADKVWFHSSSIYYGRSIDLTLLFFVQIYDMVLKCQKNITPFLLHLLCV